MNENATAHTATIRAGERIKFSETGARWWTVRAANERFAVLTQQVPFEEKGTLRYSVMNHESGVRGPCNLIGQGWGDGTYSDDECAAMLTAFEAGKVEVSHRNNVPIQVIKRAEATR